MRNNLSQQYEAVKAEYKSVQKTLAELEAKEVDLKNSLMRLNLCRQLEEHGITRIVPVGDVSQFWGISR